MTTSMGYANAASSVSALIYSNRFDLSRTYFLIAGIAGVDPMDGTLGSAHWARFAVDGGLQNVIDAREIPSDWSTGYVAIGAGRPGEKVELKYGSEVYRLNEELLQKAYILTKDVELTDGDAAKAYRSRYTAAPANAAPRVSICDTISMDTWWHGSKLGTAMEAWARLITNGEANYCTTQQEDNATLTALRRGADANLLIDPAWVILKSAAESIQFGGMKHVDMRKLPAAAQEERRRQVVGLRESGLTYDAIAAQVGLTRTGVFDICRRFAEQGLAGLASGPRGPGPRHGAVSRGRAGSADPRSDPPAHARRTRSALRPVEPGGGADADRAALWGPAGGAHHGHLSGALGLHGPEAAPTGLRAVTEGGAALAAAGLPGHRGASQRGEGHDLLGGRDRLALRRCARPQLRPTRPDACGAPLSQARGAGPDLGCDQQGRAALDGARWRASRPRA